MVKRKDKALYLLNIIDETTTDVVVQKMTISQPIPI